MIGKETLRGTGLEKDTLRRNPFKGFQEIMKSTP